MSRLDRLLRLRHVKEQARIDALAASRRAREAAEAQASELDELKSHYAAEMSTTGPARANGLYLGERRFYRELDGAVQAQSGAVARLERDEAARAEQYLAAHRHRRALETVIAHRDERIRTEARRAERRGAIRPAADRATFLDRQDA